MIRSEAGQAMVESILSFKILLILLPTLVGSLVLFGLKVQLSFVAQELATCALSRMKQYECEQGARIQSEKLLRVWGVQNVRVQSSLGRIKASLRVQGRWGPFSLHWLFQEHSPLEGIRTGLRSGFLYFHLFDLSDRQFIFVSAISHGAC